MGVTPPIPLAVLLARQSAAIPISVKAASGAALGPTLAEALPMAMFTRRFP